MKKLSLLFLLCIPQFIYSVYAQNKRFIVEGIVEYEKTINMYAVIARNTNLKNEIFRAKAFEEYKKSYPQFKKLKSTLIFANRQSLFIPKNDVGIEDPFSGDPMVSQHNMTYLDFVKAKITTQKNVFGKLFLLKDSIRVINWKLTDERRDIAGYSCRRANALVLDSVYIVAFFSEQINISSGPESFSGLPGLILGLAIPHENITWFATKVIDQKILQNTIIQPVNGKAFNYKELSSILLESLRSWNISLSNAIKDFLL